jgi:hypothetical protein
VVALHFKSGTPSPEIKFTVPDDYPNLKMPATKGPKKIGGTFVERAAGETYSFKMKFYEQELVGQDSLETKFDPRFS